MCTSCGTDSAAMFFDGADLGEGTLCNGCFSVLTIKDHWIRVHRGEQEG